MITLQHFIRGLFPEKGYRVIKSPDINHYISNDTILELAKQGGKLEKETTTYSYLPNEHLIAITYLRPASDEHGRNGIWNHTILIKITDYLKLTQPNVILHDFFIRELKDLPKSLEPIQIDFNLSKIGEEA